MLYQQERKQISINQFTDFNQFIKEIENNNIDDVILNFNFDFNVEDKIKCLETYNQILNYLITKGKKYEYLTFDKNRITYFEFIQFSKRIDKICNRINKKETTNDIETARVIENELIKDLELSSEGDADYYIGEKRNILKALTDQRLSCTHIGILYQYLCVKKVIPCLIKTNEFKLDDRILGHYFNLVFFENGKNISYVDTTLDYPRLLR